MNMKSASKTATPSPAAAATTNFLTMESLALPQDLYWDGKIEPSSPTFDNNELFSILEPHTDILTSEMDYDDDEAPEIKAIELDTLLGNEDYVIEICDLKAEPWNTTPKLQAPSPTQQYIDFSIGAVVSHPNPITKVTSSPFTVDSVFYTDSTLTQLTPPQSPPQNGAAVFQVFNGNEHKEQIHNVNIVETASPALFQQLQQQQQLQTLQTSATIPYATWNTNTTTTTINEAQQQAGLAIDFLPDEKIARDIQIFDEIIKNRVKELPEWIDNCETQSTCSAPSQADSVLADDEAEWLPDSSSYNSSAASSPLHFSSNSNCSSSSSNSSSSSDELATTNNNSTSKGSNKKRPRPYGRGVEDRKIRKKEQNKNAATRYRAKKKQEMASVLTVEQELLKRNEDLQRVLAERKREAKYLKSLIREFYKDQL